MTAMQMDLFAPPSQTQAAPVARAPRSYMGPDECRACGCGSFAFIIEQEGDTSDVLATQCCRCRKLHARTPRDLARAALMIQRYGSMAGCHPKRQEAA